MYFYNQANLWTTLSGRFFWTYMQRKEDNFKLVFERHYGPVLAYTKTLTNNHDKAKDIVQNCFIILWQKRPDLIESPTLKRFLFTTAYNSFVDLYRKDQRKNIILDNIKYSMPHDYTGEENSDIEQRIKRLVTTLAKDI